MSIKGISNYQSTEVYYDYSERKKEKKEAVQNKKDNNYEEAAVYEKKSNVTGAYQRDQATINRLLEEAERSRQRLIDLVEKMLTKQGQTFNRASNVYSLLRDGKVPVDEETRLQAQKDIAEDGYWGIEQTSERLVSFAKALAGGDPAKADLMIEAVKKGFSLAEKAWGGALPQICRDTLDRTISKLEEWRDQL